MKKVWTGAWALWKNLFILLAMIACGAFMLACAFKLPINTERFEISKQQIAQEKLYPRALDKPDPKANHFSSFFPDVLDGGTDTVILYTAGDNTPGGSVARAMKAFNEYFGYDYPIYWHGYVVLLRPLLSIFTYYQLRILNCILMVSLMGTVIVLLWRRKGWLYALAMLTSYVLLCPWALYKCFQYCPVFYIGNIAILLMFVAPRVYGRIGREGRLFSAFLVIGALTSYLDLLTYPLYTWGLPALMWIIIDEKAAAVGKRILQVILTGIGWIAGYGLMWMGKWILAGRILRTDVFGEAINEVFFRSGTDSNGNIMIKLFFRLRSVFMNWKHFTWWGYTILLLMWVMLSICLILSRRFVNRNKIPAMLLIGCSSFLWYLVLSNHTEGHHLFTYRIMVVLITATLFVIAEGMPALMRRTEPVRASEILKGLVVAVISLGLALVIGLGYREEVKYSNMDQEAQKVHVQGNVQFEFVPKCVAVTAFNPVFVIENGTGVLDVKIYEDGMLRYEDRLDFDGSNLNNNRVAWRFKAGQDYKVVLTPITYEGEAYTYITNDSWELDGIGRTSVDGETEKGQLLASVTYPDKALPVWELTFLVLCLGTYIMIIMNCIFRKKKL